MGLTAQDYTWDVASALPVVLQDVRREFGFLSPNPPKDTYVYGLDLISSTHEEEGQPAEQTYYLYDGLGSTRGIVDSSGNPITWYNYDAFGTVRFQTGTAPNQWLFTGEQSDGDFYYLRARYYDPAIGRFLSRDPLAGSVSSPQTQNAYPYVLNNPVNRVDPTGLCHQQLGGAALCFLVHRGKEGRGFRIICQGQDFECLSRLARPAPTPPCEAIPGSDCCYTPQEPEGFICGPGPLKALSSECAQGVSQVTVGIGFVVTGAGAAVKIWQLGKSLPLIARGTLAGTAFGSSNFEGVVDFLFPGTAQVIQEC